VDTREAQRIVAAYLKVVEAHADLGCKKGDFPESERAADQVLSLPMFPELAITDVEVVAAAITQETYVG